MRSGAYNLPTPPSSTCAIQIGIFLLFDSCVPDRRDSQTNGPSDHQTKAPMDIGQMDKASYTISYRVACVRPKCIGIWLSVSRNKMENGERKKVKDGNERKEMKDSKQEEKVKDALAKKSGEW